MWWEKEGRETEAVEEEKVEDLVRGGKKASILLQLLMPSRS